MLEKGTAENVKMNTDVAFMEDKSDEDFNIDDI